MSTSYVLIGCELGCELAIMDEIRTIHGVEDVCGVYGCSYDIIVKVTDNSQYRL